MFYPDLHVYEQKCHIAYLLCPLGLTQLRLGTLALGCRLSLHHPLLRLQPRLRLTHVDMARPEGQIDATGSGAVCDAED